MGGVVVHNKVKVQVFRHVFIKVSKEGEELLVAVSPSGLVWRVV